MKIVDRKTFLGLPEGTVFFRMEDNGFEFDRMAIKTSGPSDTNDFMYMAFDELWPAETEDREIVHTGDVLDFYAKLKLDESFALDWECDSRDGLFDDDAKFMVFEEADVRSLIERLQRCLPQSKSAAMLNPFFTFRQHRGTLEDSLKTAVALNPTMDALLEYLRGLLPQIGLVGEGVDLQQLVNEKTLAAAYCGRDERIGQHVYYLHLRDLSGPVGIVNYEIEGLAVTGSRLKTAESSH